MSDNEKSYIGVVSQYYESVNDITPYTKNGLKKGTYFVSVKNSIKLRELIHRHLHLTSFI